VARFLSGRDISKRQSGDGRNEDANVDFWFPGSLDPLALLCRTTLSFLVRGSVPAGLEPGDRDRR